MKNFKVIQKAKGHALLTKSGEKRGGGGATIFYNILWTAKVPNVWRNIPLRAIVFELICNLPFILYFVGI